MKRQLSALLLALGTAVLSTAGAAPADDTVPAAATTPVRLMPLGDSITVDDPGSSTANGTQLQLWDCDGGASQKWDMTTS